ncbi:hypothetical protein WMY93_027028 [Mugilogobius chulae]|uniref:C-type lectin domain-containing protein n=1 Tax=Mugilogobius chulae TaxID=88201 RepID=A0AAW0MVX7_9GOBI
MEYFFIDVKLNWFDAQQYCRESYTDLATISSMEDLMRLKTPSPQETWIGKFDDPASWKGVMGNDSNSWRWSATGTTSPGGYQNWAADEPNNYHAINYCVYVLNGQWWDSACSQTYAFVCFSGSSQLGTKQYTLFTALKNREDARSYCRQHYTDLATIEDETENTELTTVISGHKVWIGLYREPWRWSDGSTSNFTNWAVDQPDNLEFNQHCVKVDQYLTWHDAFCYTVEFTFHCEKAMEKKLIHVAKMKLQSAADLSDPFISILNQMEEYLLNMRLTDINLKWKILPQK